VRRLMRTPPDPAGPSAVRIAMTSYSVPPAPVLPAAGPVACSKWKTPKPWISPSAKRVEREPEGKSR
jgi:hypothetical protein